MRLELGRGHSYHRLYGVWEVLAERFLGSGWTASLAHGLGLQRGPHVTWHDFEVEGLTHPLKFAFARDPSPTPRTSTSWPRRSPRPTWTSFSWAATT
jgi:hypothetical protein